MARRTVKVEVDPSNRFVLALLWGLVLGLSVVAAMPVLVGVATVFVVLNLTKAIVYSDWGTRQVAKAPKAKKGNK